MNVGRILWAWAPALVVAGVIFTLSSSPLTGLPLAGVEGIDKLEHLLAYGLLAGCCARGLRRSSALRVGLPLLAVASLIAALYGASDEVHQMFVPGRTAEWGDLAADAVGALLGACAYVLTLAHLGAKRARRLRVG